MKVTSHIKGGEQLAAQLKRLKDAAERADVLSESALEGGSVIQQAANSKAPGPYVQTEVEKVTRTQATVKIGPDDKHWYYRFFETGAVPHRIRPSEQDMLFFNDDWSAEEVFTPIVERHPGMPARPFLRPALDENTDRAKDAVGRTLRRKLGI